MLVGRAAEQRRIDRLLETARGGSSGVLAIVAEVGMGKSALLDYAESRAQGMNVLRARGVQSETHVPFAGLFELVRPALRCLAQLPLPQATALESALALRPAQSQDRFAVGAATLGLLAAYAEESPVLVLVDDAQWFDGSSAAALLFALRRALADPVAVVITVREGEPSLLDGADLPRLTLDGLDADASTELVRQHAPAPLSDDVVQRLHRDTGGNPLALLELSVEVPRLRADALLDTPLPVATSVSRVYVERCRSLPEATRDLLLLAAAAETGDLLVLSQAARSMRLDIADLAAGEAAGLVNVVDDRVEFRHPLTRSAVYADASPERRRQTHRALARALPDTDVDRRAWHLALAALGPDDAACAALEQAGARAHRRSAYDVASRAFERAAQLAPGAVQRTRLSFAAADAAWLGGLADRAVELLDGTRDMPAPPELAASIEHLRGHIATRLGPVTRGQAILLAGAEAAVAVDVDRAVVMFAEALNAAFYAGDAATMRHIAGRISAVAPEGGSSRTAFFATMAQGMALIFSGNGEPGAALVRQAVAIADHSEELAGDPRLLAWVAMGPLWLREASAAGTLVDRAVETARRQMAVGVLPFLLSHVALDQAATDRWAQAEVGFHEAIALARETGQRTDLAAALARLAWLEARQGREDACRAHAAESLSLSTELELGPCEIWTHAALADLELGLGQPQAALDHLSRQQAALSMRGIRDVDLSPAPELVDAHLRLRQPDRAASVVVAFCEDAQDKGQPWALARAARCRGLLAPDDDIDEPFAAALALHEKTLDLFEAARTRLAYGSRLRRARQRVRAREQLRTAVGMFDRLGATPWSNLARAELTATGETARRREPATHNQLTPQELQIAMMLAEGRTTREAAAAVFLSPKTVEYHLRSVYRKLGINSREQLGRALTGLI